MPHRDPETGQFRSGDDPRSINLAEERTNYENLVHQHIQSRFRVRDATNLDPTGEYDLEQWGILQVEPAGGLNHSELAELVEIRVWNFDANVHAFLEQLTERGLVTGEMEISAHPEPKLTTDSMPNFDTTLIDSDPSDDGADATGGVWGVDRDAHTTDDAPLWYGARVFQPGALDTVNGTGLGGHTHDGPGDLYHVNFHRDLGGGPVFDDDDRIYVHGGLDVEELPNGPDLQVKVTATLRWRVQEFESRVR